MIYLDSAVALAHLFAEPGRPDPEFWDQSLGASRLLQYEVFNRLYARHALQAHAAALELMTAIGLVELTLAILARAPEPFPVRVRTMDGLHLATMDFLRASGVRIELASYDERLLSAAEATGFQTIRP